MGGKKIAFIIGMIAFLGFAELSASANERASERSDSGNSNAGAEKAESQNESSSSEHDFSAQSNDKGTIGNGVGDHKKL